MIKEPTQTEINGMLDKAFNALLDANSKYNQFNSAHEAYAVLLEEVEEVWEHVKMKPHRRNMEELEGELIQVAAMAVKFIWWARNQKGDKE